MVDIITQQKLNNLDRDISDADKALNTKAVVTPRYGASFKSLPLAIQEVIETGGFEPFETEEKLLLSIPILNKKAAYALDTHNIFLWENGGWKNTGFGVVDLVKGYFSQINYAKSNLIDLMPYLDISKGYALLKANNGIATKSTNWNTTDFIPTQKGEIFSFKSASKSSVISLAAYDQNKNFLTSLYAFGTTEISEDIIKTIGISDPKICYVRFSYYTGGSTLPFFKCVRNASISTEVDTDLIFRDFLNKKNLINSANVITGSYLDNNVLTSSASWNVTDFIAVEELTKYVSNTSSISSGSINDKLGVHFYDSSKNYLGFGVRQTYGSSFTTPQGCAFIRMNFFMPLNYATLYKGSILDYVKLLTDDIHNNATIALLLRDDGTTAVSSQTTNWKTTDFIEIKTPSIKYTLRTNSTVCSIAEYDANKNFLGVALKSKSSALETLSGSIKLRENTAFIRICYYFATGLYIVETNRHITENLLNDVGNVVHGKYIDNSYKNKVLMTLGDSITDSITTPTTYPPIVAKKLEMNLIDGARSGRRIRDAFIRTTIITDDAIRSADVITIAHGTNDFKLETSLGSIDDNPTDASLFFDSAYTATTNKTDGTFYSDYKGVIERILSINLNAKIMLIAPIRRTQAAATGTDTNAKGFKLKHYADAVKKIGEYYGLPVLDNFNTSGFNDLTIPSWTTDGLHPTPWAQENVMAVKVINFLTSN